MKKIILTLALQILISAFAAAQYGYKWIQKSTGTTNNLYGIMMVQTASYTPILITCGANGTVRTSTDEGNTWEPRNPGTTVNLNSISFAKPFYTSVVCCGDSGKVFYSTNAGVNWLQINTPTTAALNSITYTANKLIAVGNGGVIIVSSWLGSGYSPFTQVASGVTANLKEVSNETTNFICGENGTMLKSVNEGANWSQVYFPGTVNLNSVFNDTYPNTVIVCGDNGKIYFSSDGGYSWNNINSGTALNLKSYVYPQYIFGNSGTVLYNKLYCQLQNDWVKLQLPFTNDFYSGKVYSYNADKYIAAGSGGIFIRRELDTAALHSSINANNISTFATHKGVFDRAFLNSNIAGFEWPKGSGKTAIFSTGLSASCLINGQLAQTSCLYYGEYFPGAVINGQLSDSSIFRLYKVSRTDNPSSPDWQNWGCMVPFGAPYVDVNNNGTYEPLIDTPGVRNAARTFFACYTDLNTCSHTSSEEFGGGIISPMMGMELRMTKWQYTYAALNDVVFTKFEVINKGGNSWTGTRFAITTDPDLGNPDDDFVGCDTLRNMSYVYNRTNNDQIYGAAPPAVGYDILKGPVNKRVSPNATYSMSSFGRFVHCNADPYNECFPDDGYEAYTIMKGFKLDGANWLDPTQPTGWGSFKRTKKIYYGDPETNQGWTAAKSYIVNYGNDSVGYLASFEITRDKVFSQGMGADTYSIYSGDTIVIWLAQLVARGSSNLNSVTKLKELSDVVQGFFDNNFTIGVNRISSEVPLQFSLKQNYPNPFNPVTKIKFDVSKTTRTKISVYDVTGRELKVLVNDLLQPGTYETTWDASGFSSGVYFYRLTADDFKETKKMALIK